MKNLVIMYLLASAFQISTLFFSSFCSFFFSKYHLLVAYCGAILGAVIFAFYSNATYIFSHFLDIISGLSYFDKCRCLFPTLYLAFVAIFVMPLTCLFFKFFS